jgi:DeoR/GlpR family transcriptional regulator of sugar metabolism
LTLLAPERRRAILAVLARQGSVRVSRAAADLRVTQETIRRDLEVLEREGRLVRSHGGAIPIDADRTELPLGVREAVHLKQKRAIAARAAATIREGQVIALDASSTARELARLIPDVPLTVVTNSLAAATVLADRAKVRVIVTGGVLDGPSHSFVGELATEMLDRFHFTRAFISCQGIDVGRGLSVTADQQAGIKRRMLALADESVLLADSSKFGVKAVEFFAKVTDVDTIITDRGADAGLIARIEKAGVRVDIATDASFRHAGGRA